MRNVAKYLMIFFVSVSMCFVLSGVVLADLGPDVDDDGDTYTENQGDCNDDDAAVNPGATEVCNGLDNDCDGIYGGGTDIDGDGWGSDCDNCPDDSNPLQADSDAGIQGMRAYWKFEEGTGLVAYDIIDNSDGPITSADWAPPEGWCITPGDPVDCIDKPPVNGALWFKGAQRSDITFLDNSGNMAITGKNISVEVWVYGNSAIDNYSPQWSTIAIKSSYACERDPVTGEVIQCHWYDDGYGLYYQPGEDGGDGHMAFFINDYQVNKAYSAAFTKDEWHHVVGTYDGVDIKIYVDGVEGTSEPYTEDIVDAQFPEYFSISGT